MSGNLSCVGSILVFAIFFLLLGLFVRWIIWVIRKTYENRTAGLFDNPEFKRRMRRLWLMWFSFPILSSGLILIGFRTRASSLGWEIIGIIYAVLLVAFGVVNILIMRLRLRGVK